MCIKLPYSRKYWRELNLVVEPKIAISRMLADLHLAVRYGIAICIYASDWPDTLWLAGYMCTLIFAGVHTCMYIIYMYMYIPIAHRLHTTHMHIPIHVEGVNR